MGYDIKYGGIKDIANKVELSQPKVVFFVEKQYVTSQNPSRAVKLLL